MIAMANVGVPLSLSLTAEELNVIGFDVSTDRILVLQNDASALKHIFAKAIQDARKNPLLRVTEDCSQISNCDAIILCVATPLNPNRKPDVSYIERACHAVTPYLREVKLI